MDLTTRCPQCGTEFPASLEQLQLRKGYVRCVACAHIFDGYDAVVVPSGKSSDGTSAAALASTPASAGFGQSGTGSVRPVSVATAPAVVRARHNREFTISDAYVPVAPAEPVLSLPDDDLPDTTEPSFTVRRSAMDNPDQVSDTIFVAPRRGQTTQDFIRRAVNDPEPDEPGASRWQAMVRAMWAILIGLGLALFLLQLLIVFRVQIAQQIPSLRPPLESMCARLNCQVAYSRRADQIKIIHSSLQVDPGVKNNAAQGDLLLQLTLRNTYDKSQEWPTLVLELKDAAGAMIARRNLSPDDYLPPDILLLPFAANSERIIQLPLNLQGLSVNGYQLSLFFP